MLKVSLLALAAASAVAFGCPESEKAAAEASVQLVANTTEPACEKVCEGEAKVSTVANEAKACDMAKACDLAKVCDEAKACDGSAKVTTVAAEPKGSCEAACPMMGGAAVQTVALKADEKAAKTGPCAEKACTDMAECEPKCKTECATTSLVSAMPVMMYQVGEKTMACSMTAEGNACSANPVKYVVNNVAYETKAEATAAHIAAMEAYLDSLTHVSYNVGGETMDCPVGAAKACEKAGKAMAYQVGPLTFATAEEAVKAAAMARAAMRHVAMTYEVEGQATACSMQAKSMASACSTKSVKYVVNGKKTACETSAAAMLVQARCEAATQAIASTLG